MKYYQILLLAIFLVNSQRFRKKAKWNFISRSKKLQNKHQIDSLIQQLVLDKL
jgi:hypothetical protein